MKIFTNKAIKQFFIAISVVIGLFIVLSGIIIWSAYKTIAPLLLIPCLLAAGGIAAISFHYFYKQNKIIEAATEQMNSYLAGNTNARIACDYDGELYKLFHMANTLAAVLNSHAENELRAKEFLKSTIADISHQLKTPLAALNIYNGIVQDDAGDIAVVREFTAKSEQELDRIEMLVQNLLKITRLDAGSIIIERASENIADMMNDISQHFEFRLIGEQKTIAISGSETALLFCDHDWITEAISNIAKNALDHMEAGGHIDIEWNQLPTVTQITIKDNGCGIHPEDIHHIFKRFYRSRFSKDTQGLGLGLPLAKAIVEAHDGTITVDSSLGDGTVFTISFLNLTKL